MHQEASKGIHDRFLKDPEFRASQLEHDRDEEVCIKMDDLADKDFSLHDGIRIFSIQTELVDLSQQVWKHWTIEKSF